MVKRARGSPFGDDHAELVELLGRIGVEAAERRRELGRVAAAGCRERARDADAAQQAALVEDTKHAMLAALAVLWDTSERWLCRCLSPSVGADGGGASLVEILLCALTRCSPS